MVACHGHSDCVVSVPPITKPVCEPRFVTPQSKKMNIINSIVISCKTNSHNFIHQMSLNRLLNMQEKLWNFAKPPLHFPRLLQVNV